MTTSDKPAASMILDAIRAKRERRTSGRDIAEVEAALIADLDSFDIDNAERSAQAEEAALIANALPISALAFPEIVPTDDTAKRSMRRGPSAKVKEVITHSARSQFLESSGLLGEMRQQARMRQSEIEAAELERTAANEAIDSALNYLFFFLHDLVQQLNIIKPAIPKDFQPAKEFVLTDLVWEKGFADYRTQAAKDGAMMEMVSLTCQLHSPHQYTVAREGPAIESFRSNIFDYGLQFECKEFRTERAYLERAEFTVQGKVGISVRWRADFKSGKILLESRNLERLGSSVVSVRPGAVDQALLDDFGRLLLGQPNRFRELARR